MTAYVSSLYYLRHQVQAGSYLLGILLIDLVTIRLGDDIGSQPLRLSRQWVCHRGDTGCICFVELADEVKNRRQALLIDSKLGRLELEARQMRDVFNLFACQCHGRGFM